MKLSRTVIGLATTVALVTSAAGVATGSGARSYASCSALHRHYPHGVGRTNAHDRVRGDTRPVTNFTRSNALYAHNDGRSPRYRGEHDLDRDNDGVACEQR